MKVLAICGSPRKGGNSELLLDEALKGLYESGVPYNKICLRDLNINGCNACYACLKGGRCIIKDGLSKKLYAEFERCSHLLIATPVFFSGVPAQFKALIDRFHCLYVRYFVLKKEKPLNKKCYLFLVAGSPKKSVFLGAVRTIEIFLRCIGGRIEKKISVTSVDEKNDILNRPGALRQAYLIGREIAS